MERLKVERRQRVCRLQVQEGRNPEPAVLPLCLISTDNPEEQIGKHKSQQEDTEDRGYKGSKEKQRPGSKSRQ